MTRTFGYLLIAAAIGILTITLYMRNGALPPHYSETQMLDALWRSYKSAYVEPGTYRTIDRQRGDVTTSEGQSYTMLRAVWMGDKETFDGAWKWTQDNLGRPRDNLFSWLFGERPDGTYGVLADQGGVSAASDADTDIALALVFAYARWQDEGYLESARAIMQDIWKYHVITINGTPYLLANDLEKRIQKPDAIVNPSYLAPYAYRIFAHVDPEHDWNALVDSSYDLLQRATRDPLGSGESAGLPPDWIVIDKRTGAIRPANTGELTTNYGYDALRTPWRIAMDWVWFREPRARDVLASMTPISHAWEREGRIAAVYAHDGSVVEGHETPASYGGNIGYFIVADPARARDVYESKLRSLYNPDTNSWRTPLSYYDDNWAWFGMALYTGSLSNLALASCPMILGPVGTCFDTTAGANQPYE